MKRILTSAFMTTDSKTVGNSIDDNDLLALADNATSIWIQHSLFDYSVFSSDMAEKLESRGSSVAFFDFAKVGLCDLFDKSAVMGFIKGTKLHKRYKKEKNEYGQGVKSLSDRFKNITPLITVISIVISVYNFLNLNGSLDTKGTYIRPLLIGIVAGISAIIFLSITLLTFFASRKRADMYSLSRAEEDFRANKLSFDNELIEKFKLIAKCKLRNNNINIVIRGSYIPNSLSPVLDKYFNFQRNAKITNKFNNCVNIVFSINGADSPVEYATPSHTFILEELTYKDKMHFLDELTKNGTESLSRSVDKNLSKVLLRHLGIDVINDIHSMDSFRKIANNLEFCKQFNSKIKDIIADTNQREDTIVYILFLFAFITSINGKYLSRSQYCELLFRKNGEEFDLCNELKDKLTIPTDIDSIEKIVDSAYTYFSDLYSFTDNNKLYKFKHYASAVLYLCEKHIVDNKLPDLMKLGVMCSSNLELGVEELCFFSNRVCDFLVDADLFASDRYNFFDLLLAESESRSCIYYHFIVFNLINRHIEENDKLRAMIANSPAIIRSGFLSMVHSSFDEALLQHVEFVRLCAMKERISIRETLPDCPTYMDTFILNSDLCQSYYTNLVSIKDNDTIDFIRSLYNLYNISLKDSTIIDDSFFFINKTLIETEKDWLLSDMRLLCSNRRGRFQFENSSFEIFINDVEKIFVKENVVSQTVETNRELYKFLLTLYYYANNTVLEENFAKFIAFILDSEHIGVITRCELLSEFVFYHNYQKRRISKFLSDNLDTLIKIMQSRVLDSGFTIERAYIAIPNINNCNIAIHINGANSEIDLCKEYIDLVCSKYPSICNEFRDDASLLMENNTPTDINIQAFLDKVSRYHCDLVANIIDNYIRHDKKYIKLVRDNFEYLKKSNLTCSRGDMIIYLNDDTISVNDKDKDILEFLTSDVNKIKQKSYLSMFQDVLVKWHNSCAGDFKEIYVKTINHSFSLRRIKVKTDAIEFSSDANELNNKMEELEAERKSEVDKFFYDESKRQHFSQRIIYSDTVVVSKYREFLDSIKNNVFLNPFIFLNSESEVVEIVDLIFQNTTGKITNDVLIQNGEYLFFLLNILYLYHEAPKDEQNMFMIAELFCAAISSNKESDLDRLFNLLREKKPNSEVLKRYDEYKAVAIGNQGTIIASCIKRIAPLNEAYYESNGDMLNNIQQATIFNYAESFISNTQCLLKDNDCGSVEKDLIVALFGYMNEFVETGKRTYKKAFEIINDLDILFSPISNSDYSYDFVAAYDSFSSAKSDEKAVALQNLQTRLSFWKAFK